MVDFQKNVAKALSDCLMPLGFAQEKVASLLETPPQPEWGDIAFPCFALAPVLKKSPVEIAKELEGKIKKVSGISKITARGPYLNFFVDTAKQNQQVLLQVLKQKQRFGLQKPKKKPKIMVEYSSPNTNKPLHIGHLRNQAIGMALANMFEATGARVIKANLLSDRGIHICKSILAYQKFGDHTTPKSEMKKSDHFVGEFYMRFAQEAEKDPALNNEAQQLLKKWETNDPRVRKLWQKMNKWAIEGFKQTYRKFGSRFDVWFKESDFFNKAKPIIKTGLQKGVLAKAKDGAIVAPLKSSELPDKVVLRRDGTALYITNDLALTPYKFSHFKLNQSIWVVGSEQNTYFKQLFKIFELLGFAWASACRHVAHGLVHLPQGRLKSREGKVVDADQLINDMEQLAVQEVAKRFASISAKEKQKRAEKIALAAIKFFMLKFDARKDFTFHPEESLSFEGETGPYLLYAYARAKSILRKARNKETPNFSLLTHARETHLVKLMAAFPSKILETQTQLSPHVLCHYLVLLAAAFNSFYHELPVLNADPDTRNARLALVTATAMVLSNGLQLLGIETLEKM